MLPFTTCIVDNAGIFDARVPALGLWSKRFLTSEKKNVTVNSFANWRSGDAGLFISN
jgi:membrane protease subunit HflC